MKKIEVKITHIFRESNVMAGKLANIVVHTLPNRSFEVVDEDFQALTRNDKIRLPYFRYKALIGL